MVNPYVLIATHQRLSITKKNIDCLLACKVGIILIVSDHGEYELFKQLYPMIVVERHSNLPLGRKWQAGVNVAKKLKADPLIINGSDDILSPEFFDRAEKELEKGYGFIGLKSWYVYDLKQVYKFEYLANLPLGGGRVYSKEMLDSCKWAIFDTSKSKHLDDLGYWKVQRSGLKHLLLWEPYILSIKGDWPVMNPADKIMTSRNARLLKKLPAEEVLKQFNYVRD
jgi:hypothetical protein